MNHHDALQAAQGIPHGQESGIDAFRQHDGQPCMYADATHVRDRLETFEEAGQPAVAQGERVAATQ
jgi:hypothetical protein